MGPLFESNAYQHLFGQFYRVATVEKLCLQGLWSLKCHVINDTLELVKCFPLLQSQSIVYNLCGRNVDSLGEISRNPCVGAGFVRSLFGRGYICGAKFVNTFQRLISVIIIYTSPLDGGSSATYFPPTLLTRLPAGV